MFTTYILYSQNLNKYYVGYTSMSMPDRLRKHIANHRGFTGRANDWRVVYFKCFSVKMESIVLERNIKKRGAYRFLKENISSD